MTTRQTVAGTATPDDRAAAALLAEYDRLKSEQAQRIGFRDNFVYVTLAAAAAVVAATQQFSASVHLLLALPVVCAILGWTYVANDRMVTAIGAYVRRELAPGLAELAGRPVFGWEIDHTSDRRRRRRKRLQLVADLATFAGPGAAALLVYWTQAPWHPALAAVSALDVVALAALAWQIVAAYREG